VHDSFDFNAYGTGSYTISIEAVDKDADWDGDALSSSVTRTVNVLNTPPAASLGIETLLADRREGAENAIHSRGLHQSFQSKTIA
jgi:hypothetical protein